MHKIRPSSVSHRTVSSRFYNTKSPAISSPCFKVKEHVLPCQYIREYPGATLHDQEDPLELHINQYTPLDKSAHRPGALTIIGAHANGFPKVGLLIGRVYKIETEHKTNRSYTSRFGKTYVKP